MKHITTLLFIVVVINCSAQQVVSAGGEKLAATSINIEFTIGDIAVNSWSQNSLFLFEGFQAANYQLSLVTGLLTETAFAFFPNPTQKSLTVTGDFAPSSTFRITDVSGRDFELPTELTAHRAVVDVSSLPSSMYVLTIQDNGGIAYRVKFIKAL